VQPGPTTYTLLDLIMAGGCLGLCTLALLPIGVAAGLLALWKTQRRRTAILVPSVFAGLALLTSTLGVVSGYVFMSQKIAVIEAAGDYVSEADRADGHFLLWSTGIQGAIVCAILLGMVMLALLVKRDRDPDGA
jgi:hypothetical protein